MGLSAILCCEGWQYTCNPQVLAERQCLLYAVGRCDTQHAQGGLDLPTALCLVLGAAAGMTAAAASVEVAADAALLE